MHHHNKYEWICSALQDTYLHNPLTTVSRLGNLKWRRNSESKDEILIIKYWASGHSELND